MDTNEFEGLDSLLATVKRIEGLRIEQGNNWRRGMLKHYVPRTAEYLIQQYDIEVTDALGHHRLSEYLYSILLHKGFRQYKKTVRCLYKEAQKGPLSVYSEGE